MLQETFHVPVADRTIAGVLHLCTEKAPAVVTCHGLFSSKDSDKFLLVAEAFQREGFAVARFDFGGCGDSTGAMADTTVTRRLQELEAVMRHLAGHKKLSGCRGILGSSLGGYVGLLYAARHPVAALSVWATPCDLLSLRENIPQADLHRLRDGFFADARTHDLAAAAAGMQAVQVIHGTDDALVPCGHAEIIHRALHEPKDLLVLPGADHSLSQPALRQTAVRRSLDWFARHLPRNPWQACPDVSAQ